MGLSYAINLVQFMRRGLGFVNLLFCAKDVKLLDLVTVTDEFRYKSPSKVKRLKDAMELEVGLNTFQMDEPCF